MSNGAMVVREAQSAASLAMMDPRTAIAARGPEDVWRMAAAVAKSGLYGCKSAEEAMIRMATGMELGLSPMQSIRGVYVITTSGVSRPTMSADMMVGVCKSRPELCAYFRLVESTDTRATYETHRRGEPKPVAMTYTIEQAKRAGLAGKGTWQAHPEAMLRARASSVLARAVYSDLLNGLYTEDEADDAATPAPRAAVPVEFDARPEPTRTLDPAPSSIVDDIASCGDEKTLSKLWQATASERKAMSASDQAALRDLFAARKAEIVAASRPAPTPATEEHDAEPSEAAQ